MKLSRAVVFFVFAACGTDELATTEAPIISPATPVGPSVANPAFYPAMVGHGRLPESHWSLTSSLDSHSVRFTDGVNLAAAPLMDACWDDSERTTWLAALQGTTNAAYLQSPELVPRLRDAFAYADTKLDAFDTTTLELAASVFDAIPGFEGHVLDERTRFTTWTTPRARWLDSQWHTTLHPAPPYPETHYRYPTPSGLAAIPQRGARLYCAAREMARRQRGGSLGEQVLLPLSILGQPIDIGVVEASAYVDMPERFTNGTTSDGAQAFAIPLSLGTKITPVRHFLPPLPELRYPLVLTAADSEIITDVGGDLIYEGQRCFSLGPWFGSVCVPIIWPDFRTRYKTVSHVDAMVSKSQAMQAHAQFPLFWAGAALVELGLSFSAGVGRAAPPPDEVDSCSSPDSPTRPSVADDRILEITPPPAGWPKTIRDGKQSGNYLDGPWSLNTPYNPNDAAPRPFNVRSIDGTSSTIAATFPLAPTHPMSSAVLADDDHHVGPRSELGLSGGLIGTFGLNAVFSHVEIVAKGTVTGTLGLAHDVRDAVVSTLAPLEPITAVTITPTGYGDAKLVVKVTFSLHIDLWIGDIDVNFDIINETIPVASFTSPWDESHRVRLGTGSASGDPTNQPTVTSRHRNDPAFLSFPAGNSVDACLADDSLSPPPPPRCESTFTPGVVPRVENCMYITLQSDDQCAHIPVEPVGYAQKCAAAKLTYLCNPVSKIQDFGGEHVLAHKMVLSANISDLSTIEEMIDLCAHADETSITPTDAGVTEWFSNQFHIAACDASATLVPKGEVIKVGGPSGVTGGTCPPAP